MSSLRPYSLYDLATFARASVANYRNTSGVVTEAAAGEARIDRDPASLAVRGLLIEEARTNVLLNSAALSTQSVSVTAQAYTLSFFGTGTVTLSGASTAGPLAGTATNTRVSLTFTPSAGSLTLTVSGSVLYAQLEAGPVPTSWITTAGASATRAAESAVGSLAGLFESTAGTLAVEYMLSRGNGAASSRVVQLDDGTESNRLTIFTSNGYSVSLVTVGGVDQASMSIAGVTSGAVQKVAFAFSANDFAMAATGGTVQTDTAGSLPTVTTFRIGHAIAGDQLNGYVRRIRYYPRRLTNNELTALVA